MSKGRKDNDAKRKELSIQHCPQEHCGHVRYHAFWWASCKIYRELVNNGKCPQDCPYNKSSYHKPIHPKKDKFIPLA